MHEQRAMSWLQRGQLPSVPTSRGVEGPMGWFVLATVAVLSTMVLAVQ